MRKLNQSDILEEIEVCSYCYEPQGDKISCCGENHFEPAYITEQETILVSEVQVL